MADAPPASGGGMKALTNKVGGLPLWAWVALSTAAGVAALLWTQSRRKSAADEPAPPTTPTAGQYGVVEGFSTEQYESLLALIRDLQGAPSTPVTPGDPPSTTVPEFVMVTEGTNVEPWLASINEAYGIGLTEAKVRLLNPGIRIQLASAKGYDPQGTVKVFNVGTTKQVKIR